MKSIIIKSMVVVLLLSLFVPIVGTIAEGETAGTDGGELRCNTNVQLIPQADAVGGGNVDWRLEGEAARDLRRAILLSQGKNESDTLTTQDLEDYLLTSRMLESYLQRGQTLRSFRDSHAYSRYGFTPMRDIDPDEYIVYYGMKIERSSLNTNSMTDDTSGLIGTTGDDTSRITIQFTLGLHESPGSHEYDIRLADHRILSAVFDAIIIPNEELLIDEAGTDFETEFELEKSNLLVKDGDVQARLIRFDPVGDYTLLDPQENNYVISEDGSVELLDDFELEEGDSLRVFYGYNFEWQGRSLLTHWSYIVGTNSFYSPSNSEGNLYNFRTPAGEVIYYSVEFDGTDAPEGSIKWREFNIFENPQILFVIAVVLAYFSAGFPKKSFKKYRKALPKSLRADAEKIGWTHLLCRIFSISILVLYLVPILGPLFIRGEIFILSSIGLTVLSAIISKSMYGLKAEDKQDIPKKPKKSMEKKKKKPSNVKRAVCKSCEEEFTIPKERNPLGINCPSCGEALRKLREGYNYILLAEDVDEVFSIFSAMVETDIPYLIITTKIPSKIREKYGLDLDNIMWLSDQESDEYKLLDPNRLEFEITRVITNFSQKKERGVIFLDGLEYLIVENGFERVSKFIKKTADICSINVITYVTYVNPNSISEEKLSVLKSTFDHAEDLT